jgi:hypothetical protein
MEKLRLLLAAVAASVLALAGSVAWPASRGLEGVPAFAHVVVIFDENKDYDQIVGGAFSPNLTRLARAYGDATRFYAEVHPSEPNYVALLGGDTFGIHDDDPFYCHAGSNDRSCLGAAEPGYPDHTVTAPNFGDQLTTAGRSWKGYYESLPEPGSLVYFAGDATFGDGTRATALYASKHSGFINFASVQRDPDRARRMVGFDQLDRDLANDDLPDFALIVPNQCNDMHGLHGLGVPADCDIANLGGLIRRGDAALGVLVARLQATRAWRSAEPMAIVITFDEGAGRDREGCCGVTPEARSNFGGGHIPTLVITNHGPRGLADNTPYNHYSLLRTLEDCFGITSHLAHAGDTTEGVLPMARLFGGR